MTVIGASAFLEAVDGRRAVIDRIAGEDLHAPHLLDVEVLSALRRLTASNRLDHGGAAWFLGVFAQADIRRHPHTPLVDMVWSLRHSVSAHDATYLGPATVLDAPLVDHRPQTGEIARVAVHARSPENAKHAGWPA